MDTVRYAEASAGLLNADLPDTGALVAHIADREWLHPQVTVRDVDSLRRFQAALRPVFEASGSGDTTGTVDRLNDLMERHPITPRIARHESGQLHLHVADTASTVADLVIAESLLGLATLVCGLGATRLGVCSAQSCTDVYVDTSPNQSRRYCSDRCSSRANVAAYRARQRALAEPGGGPA